MGAAAMVEVLADLDAFPPQVQDDAAAIYAPKIDKAEARIDWTLPAEQVGRQDNFFELGGDSIVALKVVSRIRQQGLQLPLKALFEQSRLADCAASLQREAVDAPVLRALPRGGDLPLSNAQQRLWFLHQLAPEDASYNMPDAVRLTGRLDTEALGRTLREIVRRWLAAAPVAPARPPAPTGPPPTCPSSTP